MREYSIDDTGGGPPIAVIAERCDEQACEQRYALPQGDLGFPVLPLTPHLGDMPVYLKRAGWTHDHLMGRWLCPSSKPVRAMFADGEAQAADREEALRTQELDPADFIEQPDTDPAVTVPDMAAALAGTTDQAEEAAR